MPAFASFDHLRSIASTHEGRKFVWPDEGEFAADGWQFNAAHRGEFEPLWIDPTTASLMCKVYDALSEPKNRDKFVAWVAKHRGTFGKLVDFCWQRVKS